MNDIVLVRREIRPGKTQELREWFDELTQREDEVLETLANEGVYTESVFFESTADVDYIYYYMEAADMNHAKEAVEESEYPIDAEHTRVMERTLTDELTKLEPLAHFENSIGE
ncbi:DUF6176 family protein [Haladaptatus sp. NG-SE-30]